MDWVTLITRYYQAGYYTDAQVAVFVVKSKITADEYKAITGQDYSAPAQ